MRVLLRRVLSSAGLGVISQGIAFFAGILVVRSLDRSDYAAYALCSAIAGGVIIIADSGINSTLISAAAPVRDDADRLGALYAGALHWRRRVWLLVIVPACALLTYLLLRSGSSLALTLVAVGLTAASTFSSLSIGLAAIELQLKGRFRRLQTYDIANAALRFVLIVATLLTQVAGLLVYLGITVVTTVSQATVMLRALRTRVPRRPPAPAENAFFARAVRSTAAAGIFLIIGEQLVSVVLVQRHNPLAIADIAALGRFALVFGLVNVVIANLAAPYAARALPDRRSVRWVSLLIMGAYLAVCVLFIIGTVLFDGFLLALLGPQYERLRVELVVVACGAALANFSTSGIGILLHARGWVAHSWTYGPFLLIWLVVGVTVADVSTTLGACMLSASLPLPLLASNTVRFLVGYLALPVGPGSLRPTQALDAD